MLLQVHPHSVMFKVVQELFCDERLSWTLCEATLTQRKKQPNIKTDTEMNVTFPPLLEW